MNVLVTGANGQLGSEIRALGASYDGLHLVFATRADLALEDLGKIPVFLNSCKPDVIVNTAAYTAVDQAEKESALADTVNHLAVKIIADWCHENNVRLIHISTDYVFDGSANLPLKEETEKAPINEYGKSKHLGEEAVLESEANAIIIRTAWVYSQYGKNFVKTVLRLMAEKEQILVVNDQIGSPTYAADLARAILDIVNSKKWVNGIYHYSNQGRVSWYDLAVAIRDIKRLKCDVVGVPTTAYPTPAKRPKYSLLDKRKIQQNFGVKVPDWRTSLAVCLDSL